MKTQTSNAAIPVLLSTVATKTCTFREITKPAEMEKLFRLRYEVYSESGMSPFLKPNVHRIDMDVYDLHSRHFGIYLNNDLIAGVRAVIDKGDYYNPDVYEIGRKYGVYADDKSSQVELLRSDYPDFPFLSYPTVPVDVKQFYEEQKKDKKVFMSSRCVIDANHRGLKTIQFLTESILTIGILLCGEKAGMAVTDVSVPHSKFYPRYGFKSIENAPVYFLWDFSIVTLTIFLSTNLAVSSIPQYLHPKFEAMIEEYNRTKMIIQKIQ
jgi:hypothetical protein